MDQALTEWLLRMHSDGDGREELLFDRDGQLICTRGREADIVWSWPLPDAHSALVHEAFQTRPGEVVVWSGRTVYGLDATSGQPLWLCEGDLQPNASVGPGPSVTLLPAIGRTVPSETDRETADGPTEKNGLPDVLFHGHYYWQSTATVVRRSRAIRSQPEMRTDNSTEYRP